MKIIPCPHKAGDVVVLLPPSNVSIYPNWLLPYVGKVTFVAAIAENSQRNAFMSEDLTTGTYSAVRVPYSDEWMNPFRFVPYDPPKKEERILEYIENFDAEKIYDYAH